jgi:hypothetical protein
MLAGVNLEESVKVFGHTKGTTTRALAKALWFLGLESCFRLIPFKKESTLPRLCILKQVWPGERNWHWVVYNNGLIYCPTNGIYEYADGQAYTGGKFTSYLSLTFFK